MILKKAEIQQNSYFGNAKLIKQEINYGFHHSRKFFKTFFNISIINYSIKLLTWKKYFKLNQNSYQIARKTVNHSKIHKPNALKFICGRQNQKMRSQKLRRSKSKLSGLHYYMQMMNNYVSSSEEQFIKTDYEPQIVLNPLKEELETKLDALVKDQGNITANLEEQYDQKTEPEVSEDRKSKQVIRSSCGSDKVDINSINEQNHELQKKQESQECYKVKQGSSNKNEQESQEISDKIAHSQQNNFKNDSFVSKKQETVFETKKKNKFLTKDQKIKLEYDIKSQRFLLPDLIQKYGISRSTIKRYLSEINTYGEILIPNQKTRVVSGSKQNRIQKFIKESIEKHPFLSQKQMALMIKEEMNLTVSQQTVSLILKKSNITKKKGMITYKEGNTEQNIQKRLQYAQIYQNLNENKVLFMDQTGFNECIEVEYGYAPRGKRLLKQKSGKKGHKVVVILSMTYDKICHWDIVNLSVKTENVASYIKKFSKEFRGYSLIMDNARVHKTQQVAEAVLAVGLKPVFLPPYSPQLNPIELVFGRLKTIYKSMTAIKLEQPETELSEKVDYCLRTLAERQFENYKRPVNFWISQALKRKKFNEVIEQKT